MFEKQWFPESSQEGLGNDAINFEDAIQKKDFKKCHNLIRNNLDINKQYWSRMKKRLIHLSKRERKFKLKGKKPPIFIKWNNFWPDINYEDCQILDYLKFSLPDEEFRLTNYAHKADILISSCFGKNNSNLRKYRHCFKILFLGENIRPYFSDYDLSITSDLNVYRNRNIYLPLWIFELDVFNRGKDYSDRKIYPLKEFCKSKVIDFSKRSSGIVYIGNNSEPLRESIIQEIINKKINLLRYGSQTNPVKDKIALIKKYKGTIAMENSFYPGYITEKGMHSYLGGARTLYWGSLENSPFKNHPLFININPSEKYENIISEVSKILNFSEKLFVPELFKEDYVENFVEQTRIKLRKSLSQFKL